MIHVVHCSVFRVLPPPGWCVVHDSSAIVVDRSWGTDGLFVTASAVHAALLRFLSIA